MILKPWFRLVRPIATFFYWVAVEKCRAAGLGLDCHKLDSLLCPRPGVLEQDTQLFPRQLS